MTRTLSDGVVRRRLAAEYNGHDRSNDNNRGCNNIDAGQGFLQQYGGHHQVYNQRLRTHARTVEYQCPAAALTTLTLRVLGALYSEVLVDPLQPSAFSRQSEVIAALFL